MVVAWLLLDGILHNDLYVVAQPEYRVGVEARCNALLDSMVSYEPMPPQMTSRGNLLRTPIYAQEIAHRKATLKRKIRGI
jgi:hypothetical protein